MAKDKYHNLIRQLLEEDGWKITDDPLFLKTLITRIEIDLAAEKIIAAEKGKEKIAGEIKSFIGHSILHDFYKAIGQFALYLAALEEQEPNRTLFLAIPQAAYSYLFKDPLMQKVAAKNNLKLLIFSVQDKKFVKWIK